MRIARNMKNSSINSIEIDKMKVMKELNENGQYENNNILLKIAENDETEKQSFITEITKKNSSFLGKLNDQFKREGYGLNIFENGDKYLGYFQDDQRCKNGIYIWSPEIKDKKILTECYYGNWKNNKKEGNGIYIWLVEPKNNSLFDEANFEAFIGKFEDDMYQKGTYLIKEEDEYYLYHGLFDREGNKSDDNAYFYSSKNDTLIHGRVSKDIFRNGYIFIFDSDNGTVKEMAYCNFDRNGTLVDSTYKSNLLKEDKDKEEKNICNFRNVILNVDYFGYIYDKFKEIYNYINNEIDSIDIFDNKEQLKHINKLCNDYNYNNINNDIEKYNQNKF